MYESLSIHLSGTNPTRKKEEILAAAQKRGKSVSAFILECYELVMEARKKKAEKVSVK